MDLSHLFGSGDDDGGRAWLELRPGSQSGGRSVRFGCVIIGMNLVHLIVFVSGRAGRGGGGRSDDDDDDVCGQLKSGNQKLNYLNFAPSTESSGPIQDKEKFRQHFISFSNSASSKQLAKVQSTLSSSQSFSFPPRVSSLLFSSNTKTIHWKLHLACRWSCNAQTASLPGRRRS